MHRIYGFSRYIFSLFFCFRVTADKIIKNEPKRPNICTFFRFHNIFLAIPQIKYRDLCCIIKTAIFLVCKKMPILGCHILSILHLLYNDPFLSILQLNLIKASIKHHIQVVLLITIIHKLPKAILRKCI